MHLLFIETHQCGTLLLFSLLLAVVDWNNNYTQQLHEFVKNTGTRKKSGCLSVDAVVHQCWQLKSDALGSISTASPSLEPFAVSKVNNDSDLIRHNSRWPLVWQFLEQHINKLHIVCMFFPSVSQTGEKHITASCMPRSRSYTYFYCPCTMEVCMLSSCTDCTATVKHTGTVTVGLYESHMFASVCMYITKARW